LLYRWQQVQVVAEVSGVEVARDPEVHALGAANKRLAQQPDILKRLGHQALLARPEAYLFEVGTV
jgi:hypothetical protein